MAKMYYDEDADLGLLKGKKIAVIGYGSQGHAQAQNLRDSGIDVIVSDVEGSPNWKLAEEHGFKPMDADKASAEADIIHILVPDQIHSDSGKTHPAMQSILHKKCLYLFQIILTMDGILYASQILKNYVVQLMTFLITQLRHGI